MSEELLADQRQLQRMRDVIEAFSAKRMGFSQMINNLEALLDSLGKAPEEWRDEFRQQWGKLEDTLAVSLDRDDPGLIDANQKFINNVLSRLLVMIETQRLGRRMQSDE